jgi:hypothetical protein
VKDSTTDSKEIIDIEREAQVKAYQSKIAELEKEIVKLMQVIKDNDLEDEISDVTYMSDEEIICVNEIRKLKELSDVGSFTQEEAKTLDILYKNLRMIRGNAPRKAKGKTKEEDIGKLLAIVSKDE